MLNDTINEVPVASRWEPCGNFSADHSSSPVCAACGWLDGEHGPGATVHQLPNRVTPARRLAS
jgi:hypothetical protein